MKYPKLWNGSNPVGEAKARQLQTVGSPFLSASGPGFSAGTTGAFSEVKGAEASPYLVSNYTYLATGGIIRLSVIASNPEKKRAWDLPGINESGAAGTFYFEAPQRMVHVGKGRVLVLMAYSTPVNSGLAGRIHYGVAALENLSRPNGAFADELVAEPKNSTVYTQGILTYDPVVVNINTQVSNSMINDSNRGGLSLWASGYDEGVDAYMCGWRGFTESVASVFAPPSGAQRVRTQKTAAQHFLSNTASLASQPAGSLQFVGAYNHRSPVFCIGPGKLAYLLIKRDNWPVDVVWKSTGEPPVFSVDYVVLESQTNPFMCVSSNHGRTWSAESLPFLNALIAQNTPANIPTLPRPARNFEVEQLIASFTTITYVGSGVSLIVVPRCTENAASYDAPNTTLYRNLLFRRSASGAYTRLAWPPDSWPLPAEVNLNSAAHGLIRSFGEGCMAQMVLRPDGVRCFMFTHDYGSTWQFSPALPAVVGNIPVTIKPYIDAEKPGKILLVFPTNDEAAENPKRGVHAYQTDGTFAEFKYIGRVVPSEDNQPVTFGSNAGLAAVYTGEWWGTGSKRYRPYVNPAFPKEFDK